MFSTIHPARLFALIEAIIAAVAAFTPLTGPQVAALCAVARGRTNAAAFHQTLCSIDALLLASDTLLRPVYVPSQRSQPC